MKLTVLVALLATGTAAAQERTPDVTVTPSNDSVFYDGTHFGLQIDAGAPAGATAAIVYRPWRFIRLNAGIGYDVLAFGYKGGVTLIPFHWGVVPTIGFEAGHFGQGDATQFVKTSEPALQQMLSKVGYDYVSADLGLEFGAQNRFVFFVRGGFARLYPGSGTTADQALKAAVPPGSTYTLGASKDVSYSAGTPTVKIGFLLYLF